MPSQKNIDQLNDLTEKLSQAKAVILSDYSGLSVVDQTELRQKVTESGGKFIVAKNSLFKLALKELKIEISNELDTALQGPTAFLFALEDEVSPIKALVSFAKQKELPKTKIGLMLEPSDRVLSLEEIEELALLPSRNELIAKLVGTLNSPTYRLVNALSGNLRKLVVVLKEIEKSKQAN